MDPVSLTLGILPLAGGAIKIYKSIRSKLKVFCHYSSEIERLRKRFGRQRDYFLNEIELLIGLALDDHALVKDMIKDPDHSKWHCPALNKALRARMERNFDSLEGIIDDITATMEQFQDGFQCFEPLELERDSDELLRSKPWKEAMRRLRDRVKITFDKSKFTDLVMDLRNSNDDLKRLREQLSRLQQQQQQRPANTKSLARRGRLPAEFAAFGTIRRASTALHEALQVAWSRNQQGEPRHLVRLFVDATAAEDVQMELAIICYGHHIRHGSLVQASLMGVQVRSRTIESIEWTNMHLLASSEPKGVDNEGGMCQGPEQKRRKVRFADESPPKMEDEQLAPSPSSQATSTSSVDLRLCQDICSELTRRTFEANAGLECLGHIDSCSQNGFRHMFYPWTDENRLRAGISCDHLQSNDVTLVDDILEHSVTKHLTVVSQLRLAFRIASAVLKFNSTPWLNELWGSRDLAFFHQGQDLIAALGTLHFGVELVPGRGGQSFMDVEPPDNLSKVVEEAQFKHGVRNMTLYSLGVVLLAIGRWSRVDAGDVECVRRLASQTCPLGPRYQELTQRVIDCDFGYGKDLSRPQLQEAVYEKVLLELEAMIGSLEISTG